MKISVQNINTIQDEVTVQGHYIDNTGAINIDWCNHAAYENDEFGMYCPKCNAKWNVYDEEWQDGDGCLEKMAKMIDINKVESEYIAEFLTAKDTPHHATLANWIEA